MFKVVAIGVATAAAVAVTRRAVAAARELAEKFAQDTWKEFDLAVTR